METARLNGKHLGRYLAFCWSDEVIAQRARIQSETVLVDGHEVDHRTVIQSVSTVMDLARQGCSVPKAAEILGVNRMTLTRALRTKGILDEYRSIASESRTKGYAHKREGKDGGSMHRRDGSDTRTEGNPCEQITALLCDDTVKFQEEDENGLKAN